MLRFMDIQTRKAGHSDIPAIIALLQESDVFHGRGAPTYQIESDKPLRAHDYVMHTLNEDNGEVLLAVDGERIVGLVHLAFFEKRGWPTSKDRPYAHVGDIVVTKAYWRTGVGRQLMAAAEDWARARGAIDIELGVWDFNEDAIAFYEALGFFTQKRTLMKSIE